MTENQILLLNKVDFDWRYTVIPWEKRYEELVNFVERNGHAQVPSSFPHFSLGKWVSTQRTNYKKLQNGESSSMTKKQIELLEKVSFEWDGLVKLCPVKLWDERYIELVSFFEENGHAKVPLRYPKNLSLGKWVYAQRQSYKKIQNGDSSSSLTENKILLLNKVDFDWGYEKIPWEKMYEELLNFVKENGHVRVPRSYPKNPSLGKWVSYQRTSYRRFQIGEVSSMTDDRMKLLNKAGIEWNSLHNTWDDQARVWDEKYQELASFVKEFGHARVSQKYPKNPLLGRWVSNQRANYKHVEKGSSSRSLTEEQIDLLNKLDFEWSINCKNRVIASI